MPLLIFSFLFQIGIDEPERFNGYLLLGYLVLGLIFCAYIAYLWSMQKNVDQDLQVLEQLLSDDD